jgi:ABC-type branched-subunit amino acid transport system ATPase component
VSTGLVVDDLTIAFGGHVAVDGLSLRAPRGQITGLIGPNGAGKTSSFNACTGLNRPQNGTITLDGRVLGSLGPAVRAQLGMGRTFQKMELYDSLTVEENVGMGREAGQAASRVLRHLFATSEEKRDCSRATASSIELCGLTTLKERVVGSLSTGQRRLVELARVLASTASMLLLDEPSSGLDAAESQAFGEIVGQAVRERGVGVLLVEHDMTLVTAICDRIYVLDFGRLIFTGTTDEMLNSPVVRSAYLGAVDDERKR